MTPSPASHFKPHTRIEWKTLALLVACYIVWLAATSVLAGYSLLAGMIVTCLAITLHSSLQHEVLHGHPLPNRALSEVLVWPAIGLAIPYERFRDTHLSHHRDARLTDPYDDPESNYLDPKVWQALPGPVRAVLSFNNTLLGRLLVGPLVSQIAFMRDDWRLARGGDASIRRAWLLHAVGLVPVLTWLWIFGAMPWWAYALCAYLGLSILKIRTFLEHRAHLHAPARTVIIEDRGPLAFLFLNNNLHAVHHAHPAVPWYELPALYRSRREQYQHRNSGYVYRSYLSVFRRYLVKAKDPVPHPLYPS